VPISFESLTVRYRETRLTATGRYEGTHV